MRKDNDSNGFELILGAVADAAADTAPVTDQELADAGTCWQALDDADLTDEGDLRAMLALWMRHELNGPPWREQTTVAALSDAMGEAYRSHLENGPDIGRYLEHAQQAGTPQGALVQAWTRAFSTGVAITRIEEYYRAAGDDETADELRRLDREHIEPTIHALVRHAKATTTLARRQAREKRQP